MKRVLDCSHSDARIFFLKEESYFNFDLPKYFVFQRLLDQISQEIQNKELSDYYRIKVDSCGKRKTTSPRDYENVNYRFLNNKDGKFAWRPVQLIHPAIYVSLVHKITQEDNWDTITNTIKRHDSNSKIKCFSFPVESEDELSDKATTINNWWHSVEQKSVELALKYEYILHTDISDCYGSIYTHSIAWALHTRQVAKNKRTDNSLIGNIIDKHIQDMSFGQTNGIPQGSALMDFIAEIILGYADFELSNKINDANLENYEILRYRDDYRIFTNNPQDADLIVKLLTEVLVDLGLKLNSQKTLASNAVVIHSIKPDKLYWIANQRKIIKLQECLLFIHDFSCKYPNSGTLDKVLQKFFDRIKNLKKDREDVLVLISILVDIMFNNPRTYPIGSAILSKFLFLIKSKDKQIEILETVISRFRKLPNIGYLEIWIQRVALKINKQMIFEEPICKKLNDESSSLWNSDWLGDSKVKKIINNEPIVDEKIIEEIGEVIEEGEVIIFRSKNYYF